MEDQTTINPIDDFIASLSIFLQKEGGFASQADWLRLAKLMNKAPDLMSKNLVLRILKITDKPILSEFVNSKCTECLLSWFFAAYKDPTTNITFFSELLSVVRLLPFDIVLLKKYSKFGQLVKRTTKHENQEIAAIANEIYLHWKCIITEAGSSLKDVNRRSSTEEITKKQKLDEAIPSTQTPGEDVEEFEDNAMISAETTPLNSPPRDAENYENFIPVGTGEKEGTENTLEEESVNSLSQSITPSSVNLLESEETGQEDLEVDTIDSVCSPEVLTVTITENSSPSATPVYSSVVSPNTETESELDSTNFEEADLSSKGKKRKKVSFAADPLLCKVRYIESTAQIKQTIDKAKEFDHSEGRRYRVKESMSWYTPQGLELVLKRVHFDSEESEIQAVREENEPCIIYLTDKEIPLSPFEPDELPLQFQTPILEIPLDEVSKLDPSQFGSGIDSLLQLIKASSTTPHVPINSFPMPYSIPSFQTPIPSNLPASNPWPYPGAMNIPPVIPIGAPTNVCKMFAAYGTCNRGNDCPFQHSKV